MARLFYGKFFVRMAEIEKQQHIVKKLIDLSFADLVRSEEVVQVEIRESAIGHTRGQERPQVAGVHGAQLPGFLEYHALQGVVKDTRIQQPAELTPGAPLTHDPTNKAQSGC